MKKETIFYQLFEPETSTYTYLLGDPETREAVLIDSVRETVDRDLKLVDEIGLKLKYILDTHIHADHITAAGLIRQRTGAKTAVSAEAGVDCVDVPLEDGQELQFGGLTLKAISTPGHTNTCMSFYCDGRVFTGDALLIRGTGRTDFQQGSSDKLYSSVTEKLFRLPDDTKVYPGHDYRGQTASTIELEKKHNPRLGGGRSREEFVKIMSELKLAHPKKIHEAVPANLLCGLVSDSRRLHPQLVDGRPEVQPDLVSENLSQVRIVDVRRPDEFTGELGHIPGAQLVTLGPDLEKFLESADKSEEIVFVCRSGGRSGQATDMSRQKGFEKTVNMQGGMLLWNELHLPTEKS